MRLDLPLRRGFPQWAGILTSFIVILPVSMMNGAYTGSALEISNTLGAMSEDVMMAYYCASAGMAIAYPVVPKVIDHISPRTLLLVDLFLQVLLSLVCAKTEHISVVTGASFMLGFLKAFVMLWFIRAIKPWFTPKDVRSEFYAYFYPLVFSGGQLSMMFTAMLSYYYDWKYMYYLMMMLLLLAMLAVLVVFRHTPAKGSIPVGEIDFKNMTVASVGILVMMFFFNYGKPLDWFHSPVITACCIIAPLLLCVFLVTLATLFVIIAAYSSRSPWADAGADRECLQVMSYEPMLLIMTVGFFTATQSFDIARLFSLEQPIIVTLIPIFIGLLFILTIKLRKSPFDLSYSHHAHQELLKGITTEMTGRTLAKIEIMHWCESVLFLMWVGMFFIWDSPISIAIAVAVVAVTWFLEVAIDNNFARMKWQACLKLAWLVALVMGVVNLFYVLITPFI